MTETTTTTQAIPADAPEPLSNAAGRVLIKDGGFVTIEVTPDAGMRGAGITRLYDIIGIDEVQEQKVLRCSSNKAASGKTCLRLADRPELEALVLNRDAIQERIQAARKAVQAQERQAAQEQDENLRAAMRAEAEQLIRQIPAGHIRVTVTQDGDSDGTPLYTYTAPDGTDLSWRDITTHGTAVAIRPGAWGAFDFIVVASIAPEKLAQIKAEQAAKREAEEATAAAKKAERAARYAEAKATGKPVYLSGYMDECDGSAEGCSFDNVFLYAMPDGTTSTRRAHCH